MAAKSSPLPVFVLRGHREPVNSIDFLQESFRLLSGSLDGKVILWDLELRRPSLRIAAHNSSILSIHDIPNHQWILSSSRDGTFCIWDTEKSQESLARCETGCEHFCVSDISCNTDIADFLILTPDNHNSVLLWDSRNAEHCIGKLTPLDKNSNQFGMITTIRAGTTHNIVYAGYENGLIVPFDLRTRRILYCHNAQDNHPVLCIDESSSGRVISGGGDDKISFSQDACSHATNLFQEKILLSSAGTSSLRFRCDNKLFCSAHWDGSIRVYETKKLKCLANLRHHNESVYGLSFAKYSNGSEYRTCFAASSKDGTISLWNLFESSFHQNKN